MELQRLAASFRVLLDELRENNVVSRLSSLADAAQAAAANPADPATTAAFAEKSKELTEILRDSDTQLIGPSNRRVLKATGFDNLLAPELHAQLEAILTARPFLLAQASDQLKKLAASTKAKTGQIENILSTFDKIAIAVAKPLPAYELGVLLPTSVVQSDLREISSQLKEWIFVIDTVTELTGGRPQEQIPLTAASAGSFEFFVKLDVEGALAFLMLVSGVAKIFTSVLAAKKRRDELANAGYPKRIIDDLKAHEESLVDEAKTQVLDDLTKESKVERSRLNELKNRLRVCIDWVLKSMNIGVDVEVNANPQREDDEATVAETTERIRELEKKIDELILDVNRTVLSLPAREQPLLELPHRPKDREAPGKKPQDDETAIDRPKSRRPRKKKAEPPTI